MNGSLDWQDAKYRETYEQELVGLERRRERDPGFTIAELEAQLAHLYTMDGNDWVGRGLLQDTIMAATLAAHESFLERWKAEAAGK